MKQRTFLKYLSVFCVLLFLFNSVQYVQSTPLYKQTKNSVILLIGDGMGFDQIEFGRLIEYGESGVSAIQEFPYEGNVSTSNYQDTTTDSSASATAISCGVKTTNGYVGKDSDGIDLETILEYAKSLDYETGLVVKSPMNHATPASFAAHNINRNNYVSIAEDMANNNVSVLLGGGSSDTYFGTQITNLETNGYTYITEESELTDLTMPVLGLFADNELPYEIDRTEESTVPTLLEMTQTAIELLNSTDNPFFLMIEGSLIDYTGHSNSKTYLAHEVIDFEKVVQYVRELADQMDNLLVLVTADHETGGFHIIDYDFATDIPDESDSLATKIEKRTDRANEISVSWSTTGHTNTNTTLVGIGPFADTIPDAQHHINTYAIMRSAIDGVIVIPDEPVNDLISLGTALGIVAIIIIPIYTIIGTYTSIKKSRSKKYTKLTPKKRNK